MTLPSIDELEESLLIICEELADNTLSSVSRRDSAVKVDISEGNAHIKVRDRNRQTSITMQTEEIEQKINEKRGVDQQKEQGNKKESVKDIILN